MLSSTPTSTVRILALDDGLVVGGPLGALDDLDLQHDQQDPDGGDADGDAREQVAGPRAEGAGAAHAAEGAGQAAALAALDQDERDQQQSANDYDDDIQNGRIPGNIGKE